MKVGETLFSKVFLASREVPDSRAEFVTDRRAVLWNSEGGVTLGSCDPRHTDISHPVDKVLALHLFRLMGNRLELASRQTALRPRFPLVIDCITIPPRQGRRCFDLLMLPVDHGLHLVTVTSWH